MVSKGQGFHTHQIFYQNSNRANDLLSVCSPYDNEMGEECGAYSQLESTVSQCHGLYELTIQSSRYVVV